jgi:hypothetical protein
MSGQSTKSLDFLPEWLKTRRRVRQIRKQIRDIEASYREQLKAAGADPNDDAHMSELYSELEWPDSELAQIESVRLRRLAERWNIEAPNYTEDSRTGHWTIPYKDRRKLKREIRDARREAIRWWIQVAVMPLIALVSSITALTALFYRSGSN